MGRLCRSTCLEEGTYRTVRANGLNAGTIVKMALPPPPFFFPIQPPSFINSLQFPAPIGRGHRCRPLHPTPFLSHRFFFFCYFNFFSSCVCSNFSFKKRCVRFVVRKGTFLGGDIQPLPKKKNPLFSSESRLSTLKRGGVACMFLW